MPTPNAAPPLLDGPALTIETDRLRLRPHRPADLDARALIAADPSTMRFIGGPQSREESWARILRYSGHLALFGYGVLALEEKSGGRLAGEIGLGHFERGLGADFDESIEAAWLLAEWATGMGYAREAMAAVIAWHHEHGRADRIVAVIGPDNLPSIALASALGFRPFREASYRDHRVVLYERTA
jgi:RimJ/RimL family protein N-acetyltransferase